MDKLIENKNNCLFLLVLFTLLLMGNLSFAQDPEFKRTSLKTGIGIGSNEGEKETGMGLLYSVGWQKSYGKKNKLRLNPNMVFGGFLPIGITDTRDQFYRITSTGLDIHYDLIKRNAISIVTTGGGFVNYSRGLLGTGGMSEDNNNSSTYIYSFYFGGKVSAGIRIDPKNSKLAYEFRPVNVQFGNKGFVLGYFMFGIDFKFKK